MTSTPYLSDVFWQKQAERAAEALRGTCQSLDTVLEGMECEAAVEHTAFTARLDALVFECTGCGWWDEICMMADDDHWRCEQCEAEEEAT